jgi:hypothetical protein
MSEPPGGLTAYWLPCLGFRWPRGRSAKRNLTAVWFKGYRKHRVLRSNVSPEVNANAQAQ